MKEEDIVKANVCMRLPATINDLASYWKELRKRNIAYYSKIEKAQFDYAIAIPLILVLLWIGIMLATLVLKGDI